MESDVPIERNDGNAEPWTIRSAPLRRASRDATPRQELREIQAIGIAVQVSELLFELCHNVAKMIKNVVHI